MTHPRATTITYRYDRLRAIAAGVLETAQQTFLLLIAVKVFNAGPTAKAFVASGHSLGLLLSLFLVSRVANRGWLPSETAARLAWISAGCFALMALVPRLEAFTIGSVVAMALFTMGVPLVTQIYQDNYPAALRGRLFSRAIMIRVLISAGFSALAGEVLERNLGWYRGLLLWYVVAAVFGGFCLARCPSQPLRNEGGSHPLRALRYFRDDRLFRLMLICWMIMGFANLMMLPLRVDYLANPVYGLELSSTKIAILMGVVPNLVRLLLSPVWGHLFDRMNFFLLRALLNLGFVLAILTFFHSRQELGFWVAAAIFGAATAGGEVAWNLWVTKVAPPSRVADYMSVHTFFTGCRGLVGPLVGFHLAGLISIGMLANLSALMIVVASATLVWEFWTGRGIDPGTELVERATK